MGYWAYTVLIYDTKGNAASAQAQNENEAIMKAEQNLRSNSGYSGRIAPGRTEVRHYDPQTGQHLGTYRY